MSERDCKHGRRNGDCDSCDLENAEREIESLRQQLASVQKTCTQRGIMLNLAQDANASLEQQLAEARAGRVPEGFRLVPTPAKLKELLVVGAQIKIGKEYAEIHHYTGPGIVTLVEGGFEVDNGLYMVTEFAPSVWNEEAGDFDSIYHLFENDLSGFMDCEIMSLQLPQPPAGGVVLDEPLSVFSEGEWIYKGTGQSFSAVELNEAAFVVYRAILAQPQQEGK